MCRRGEGRRPLLAAEISFSLRNSTFTGPEKCSSSSGAGRPVLPVAYQGERREARVADLIPLVEKFRCYSGIFRSRVFLHRRIFVPPPFCPFETSPENFLSTSRALMTSYVSHSKWIWLFWSIERCVERTFENRFHDYFITEDWTQRL